MGRGPYRPSNQPVSVQSAEDTKNPYMDATIGAITNPGVAGPTMNMPAPDGAAAAPALDPRSEFNNKLTAEFSSASGGKRKPRQDELDQWWNYTPGSGGAYADERYAWKPGEDFNDYMKFRVGTHARGDWNGDNPAELGGIDTSGTSMNANKANAAMTATSGMDGLLSGDPFARIQDALGKVNGQGQVNLDALLKQLGA